MNLKKIAVINDLSGFGKCSLTAAIPVISALGVQCCPFPTALLSNQTGFKSYYCCDFTPNMQHYADEWKKMNAEFDAVLTGYISNPAQGEIISNFIDDFKTEKTLIVVDPVMADDGEVYSSYSRDSVRSVTSLAQKADLITPNLTELCILCGEDYKKVSSQSKEDLLKSVKEMSQSFASAEKGVITSGIKCGSKIISTVYESGTFCAFECEALPGSFSGTGDILSSFVSAKLVCGASLQSALLQAQEFIFKSIKSTVKHSKADCREAHGVDFEKYLYTLGGSKNEE